MVVKTKEGDEVNLTLDLSSAERLAHYDLNGRATNLFPVTSERLYHKDGLVAKVFWEEKSRMSESDILKKAKGTRPGDGVVP